MKEFLEIGKTAIEIVKCFVVLALILLLFAWPEVVSKNLARAGITEGDFWGLKYKAQVSNNDQKILELNSIKSDLELQLRKAKDVIEIQNEALRNVRTEGVASPSESQKALSSLKEGEEINKIITAELNRISSVSGAIDQLLIQNSKSLESDTANGSSGYSWAIVAGGDTLEESGWFEVNKAKRSGFNSAVLAKRDGIFRTVILFDNRSLAQQSIPAVREAMRRPDAYLVNLDSWCRSRKLISDAKLQTC